MTRYLVGFRDGGLKVTSDPPRFYRPGVTGNTREQLSWDVSNFGFQHARGVVEEWTSEGRRVIARVFPEEMAQHLAVHDEAVAEAKRAVAAALASRQEFLETCAARAKPVRVAEARCHRQAWKPAEKSKTS